MSLTYYTTSNDFGNVSPNIGQLHSEITDYILNNPGNIVPIFQGITSFISSNINNPPFVNPGEEVIEIHFDSSLNPGEEIILDGIIASHGPIFTTPIDSIDISASSTTSTSSLNYVLMNGMTLTPPAGTYTVLFNSYGLVNSTSATGVYGISISGPDDVISSTERSYRPRNTALIQSIVTQGRVTVNGSQSIQIYYKVTASTFTVYMRNLQAIQLR